MVGESAKKSHVFRVQLSVWSIRNLNVTSTMQTLDAHLPYPVPAILDIQHALAYEMEGGLQASVTVLRHCYLVLELFFEILPTGASIAAVAIGASVTIFPR